MLSLIPYKRSLPSTRSRFFTDVEDIFSSFYRDFESIFNDGVYKDEDGNITYELEVPGFNKGNIDVELEDGVLTVKGKRDLANDKSVGGREIYQRITIGELEIEEAMIADGILTLKFKAPEEVKEIKKVEVK